MQFAEALGVPRWRILWREVLPNIATPLLVEFWHRMSSIAGIAALSVMGYGIQLNADWGLMINENRRRIMHAAAGRAAPGLVNAIFAFGINMIAEGIAGTVSGTNLQIRRRRVSGDITMLPGAAPRRSTCAACASRCEEGGVEISSTTSRLPSRAGEGAWAQSANPSGKTTVGVALLG